MVVPGSMPNIIFSEFKKYSTLVIAYGILQI